LEIFVRSLGVDARVLGLGSHGSEVEVVGSIWTAERKKKNKNEGVRRDERRRMDEKSGTNLHQKSNLRQQNG